MLDDLAGKRTGERVQILRERRGLSRPVLARLVGMSASWLKGIERGTRLPPRLPLLVKLAEALAVGDVAVLAGTDMDLCGAASLQVEGRNKIVEPSRVPESVARPVLMPNRLLSCRPSWPSRRWVTRFSMSVSTRQATGSPHAAGMAP